MDVAKISQKELATDNTVFASGEMTYKLEAEYYY